MLGTVISFCDRTGNMVEPWLDNGYRAITVDLQPSTRIHQRHEHVVANVCNLSIAQLRQIGIFNNPAMVFAFPPCTDLAVSGARWFKEKGMKKLIRALEVVEACRDYCEGSGAPYMIENPVSTLATYWRKPDHSFHPWQFTQHEPADNYTKKTCLWTGGGFVMPAPAPADLGEPDNRIHMAPPSDDRGDIRSATPMGFARAVFQANAWSGFAIEKKQLVNID